MFFVLLDVLCFSVPCRAVPCRVVLCCAAPASPALPDPLLPDFCMAFPALCAPLTFLPCLVPPCSALCWADLHMSFLLMFLSLPDAAGRGMFLWATLPFQALPCPVPAR